MRIGIDIDGVKDILDPHVELVEQAGRRLHLVSVDDIAGIFVPDQIHCREEHDTDQHDGEPYFEKKRFSFAQQFPHKLPDLLRRFFCKSATKSGMPFRVYHKTATLLRTPRGSDMFFS